MAEAVALRALDWVEKCIFSLSLDITLINHSAVVETKTLSFLPHE